MKVNDPIRVKKATIRLVAALLAAVVLLAVSGFGIFKMLGALEDMARVGVQILSSQDFISGRVTLDDCAGRVQAAVKAGV